MISTLSASLVSLLDKLSFKFMNTSAKSGVDCRDLVLVKSSLRLPRRDMFLNNRSLGRLHTLPDNISIVLSATTISPCFLLTRILALATAFAANLHVRANGS